MPAAHGELVEPFDRLRVSGHFLSRVVRKLHAAVIFSALAVVLLSLLFYSCGGGGSAGAPLSTLTTSDFHSLAFHPGDAKVVFFGHHHGLLKSEDGGRTWRETSLKGTNWDVMALAINPLEPSRMYAAGHNVFFVSGDGGKTWQSRRLNLPGLDIHGFAMDPDNPAILYAFIVGYGLFRSSDAGAKWQSLSSSLPIDVMALASAGGETLYAESMKGGILKSLDGGKTWTPAITGLEGRTGMGLAVDPNHRQNVYAATERGLFKSSDGGATWAKLPFPGENVVTIAIAPSNPQVLLAIAMGKDGKGKVYRSEDGGLSW